MTDVVQNADVPATEVASPTTPEVAEDAQETGAVTDGSAAEAVQEAPDWRSLIDRADASELRKHPKIGGIVGQMVDTAMRDWQRNQQETYNRQATEAAREELRRLAKEDPDAFAERFLKDDQREFALAQLQTLRQQETAAMAQRVGRAYASIPGWDRLTTDDHSILARAIQGLPDDEVIAAYNAKALELLAARRVEDAANERFEKFKKSELAKEREAIRAEEAAKLLKKEPKPDMTRATRQPPVPDFSRMTDADFERWYTTEGPGAGFVSPARSRG